MKYYWIFFMITLLCACKNKYETTNDFNKEIVINDVKQMFNNYYNDIRKEGLTIEFKYLDHSKNFFWVPPGYKSTLIYDSVRKILIDNAKLLDRVDLQWDTLQIFPITNKIANYSGIVIGTVIDTTGIKSSVRIIESGTLIKRKDGWKLLSGQSTNLNIE